MLNKLLFPEKFADHLMLLFVLFRHEKLLLSCCPLLYQNKLQEQGVQDVLNRNKIEVDPYEDLIDQSFSQFNENLIKNQDPQSQIENGETPEVEYPHEYAQKTQKHTKTLQFFTPNCHKYYQMIKS